MPEMFWLILHAFAVLCSLLAFVGAVIKIKKSEEFFLLFLSMSISTIFLLANIACAVTILQKMFDLKG